MPKHYRPFILSRAGELAGLARLSGSLKAVVSPVFRIPERAWDYENGRYTKSHQDHLSSVPEKLAKAWTGGTGYLDLSLLERDAPVGGKHPVEYLVGELDARGLSLVPLVSTLSTADYVDATVQVHRASGRGAALHLSQADWTTINAASLTGLLRALSMTPADVDVIVDFEGADGPLTQIALAAEFDSLCSMGAFRSVTVGGAAFPDLAGVPQGTTEFTRAEWNVYSSLRSKLAQEGKPTPDFFDHAVQNPDLIEQGVDPRFISISATLRYTVADKWLVAKGKLFKGRGATSLGGAALIPPLSALTRHPEYSTPIRSQADDWIEAVVAGSDTPGAPQKWREWGTVRHLEVAAAQLASWS